MRERAFSYLRSIGSGHRPVGREGWFFLIFGVASALCTLVVAVVGTYFWKEQMTDLLNELGNDQWEMDHVLATLAIVIVFVPFFAGMIISGARTLIQKIRNKSTKNDIMVDKREQAYEKMVLTRRISK